MTLLRINFIFSSRYLFLCSQYNVESIDFSFLTEYCSVFFFFKNAILGVNEMIRYVAF
jgi:hypothetical protein